MRLPIWHALTSCDRYTPSTRSVWMTVPKEKIEAIQELYRKYTGEEISPEEVEAFGEYIIWWICAVHDI
jgi:hypothetical protein